MKFKNKVILVTGSSSGIGESCALEFAKEGARVVINCDKSTKRAKNVLERIKSLGAEVMLIKADVSNEFEVRNMIKQIVEKFGKIDILINNAGVLFDTPFDTKTINTWRKTIDVNLNGAFLVSKAVIPHMSKGRIINITSTNGIYSQGPSTMDYDASKAGLISLTKTLAEELAPNILVNSVAPGWVNTDLTKILPKKLLKNEVSKIWLKRLAEPEEIAKVVLFLASDDAKYITGTTILIDGGHK